MSARRAAIIAMICLVALRPVSKARAADADYASYFLYLGEDPSSASPAWGGLDTEGMAHSNTHWFMTQKGYWGAATLWRVPVSENLGAVEVDTPGVVRRGIPAQLFAQGYRWFGDPCLYRFNGTDYLLVPMGGELFVPQWYRLAVFQGDENMTFIDLVPFGGSQWCGIDAAGQVYGSNPQNVSSWRRYSLNWPLLDQSGTLALQLAGTHTLYGENGVDVETLVGVAGGEVTSNGKLLYLLGSDSRFHVFDMLSGRLLIRSRDGAGFFNLQIGRFDNVHGFTIWDIEGTDSPHRGQLHVQVVNNDPHSDEGNAVKHYTRTILVDSANVKGFEAGTPEYPFQTVTAAVDLAWDGAEVRIRAGVYHETLRMDERIRVTAEGGTVRIGD